MTQAHGPADLDRRVVPRPGARRLAHAHRRDHGLRGTGALARGVRRRARGAPAPRAALPPEAVVPALRDGAAAVGGRPELQPRLPRASHRAPRARERRAAAAAGGTHLLPAPRPLQAAVGAVARRGLRGAQVRDRQQDPPRAGRRRVGGRPDDGAVRPGQGRHAGRSARARLEPGARAGRRRSRGKGGRRSGGRAAQPRAPGARSGHAPRPDRRARQGGGRRGRRGAMGDAQQRAQDAAERPDRASPAPDLGPHPARRPQGDQEQARRDRQRRLPGHGDRGAAPLADLARGPHRGAGAAVGRAGVGAGRGRERRPGQPDHRDGRPVADLRAGSGRAAPDRLGVDARAQGVQAGARARR